MSPGHNIVFILADNVGYGVLSSYNGGILDTPTARIDGFGSEGLRLTNFDVENQCTPSRRTLRTDPYAIRQLFGLAAILKPTANNTYLEGGAHAQKCIPYFNPPY
ncbi:MAG: sulfatase-like hydrolase/transferase [Bradyrhizobium sp.]|nr:sulfatase-like hydrolase/transferase [Bradyrhizobium sp.]